MRSLVRIALLFLVALPGLAEVASTSNRPDLNPVSIEIDNSGAIRAVLRNRGIEIAAPFLSYVYLDTNLRRTLVFGEVRGMPPEPAGSQLLTPKNSGLNLSLPFRAGETRTFIIRDFNLAPCSGQHSLKIEADPNSLLAEAVETNNVISRSMTAPCADLAVASIKKNWNSTHTQYVAEVTVINQGTGTTPAFSLSVQATPGVGFGSTVSGGLKQYPALAPGQTIKVKQGAANAIETLAVKVVLDVGDLVVESNEHNNEVSQLLRP